MQVWKMPGKFANRRADLQNAAQIWKAGCKSGKRRADLQTSEEKNTTFPRK
jgi:hypothetical protein